MQCNCPQCNELLDVDDALAGQQVECPMCSNVFAPPAGIPPAAVPAVPAAQTQASPAPAPAPASDGVTGIFTIETQTTRSRIAWICAIPIGIVVFIAGICLAGEAFEDIGGMGVILYLMFFFLLPFLIVIAAIRKMFQKPGVYFNGLRATPSGFETGALTVQLEDVGPGDDWRKTLRGSVEEGEWKTGKAMTQQPLAVGLFLKESGTVKKAYYFDRFVISSEKKVLHQLIGGKGVAETNANNLVGMIDGEFELLGDRAEKPCPELMPAIERSADILAAASPGAPPVCTLNIVPKTVSMSSSFMFGLVGALVASGIDSGRKRKMQKAFRDGKLFDSAFTDQLMDFIDRRGWLITAGGKAAQDRGGP
jgi:hypothetical protein